MSEWPGVSQILSLPIVASVVTAMPLTAVMVHSALRTAGWDASLYRRYESLFLLAWAAVATAICLAAFLSLAHNDPAAADPNASDCDFGMNHDLPTGERK